MVVEVAGNLIYLFNFFSNLRDHDVVVAREDDPSRRVEVLEEVVVLVADLA